MKIAYLILAHNNLIHLDRLIRSLTDDDNRVFIHFDKKNRKLLSKINFDKYKNVKVISTRRVNWGGFSIVQATIDLLKLSYNEGDFDRFVLLSGSDYPIRKQSEIKEYFAKNEENFMDAFEMPAYEKPLERVYNYHIEGAQRNKGLIAHIIRKCNDFLLKINYKRKYPFDMKLYAGSQWFAFNKRVVTYILDFMKNNPGFVKFYKHTYIPDEMFFQTIVINSPYGDKLKPSVTYTDWEIGKPPYPCQIGDIHLDILRKGNIITKDRERHFLFARKFTDKSKAIVDKIDKEFLI